MKPTIIKPHLRTLSEDDDLEALTDMLHRGYGALARQGMRYLASHQDVATTRRRCFGAGKECVVAEVDGRIVGTVTLRPFEPDSPCEYYRRPDICIAGQLAVEPSLQGQGIARTLMDELERRAGQRAVAYVAGDTSEQATAPIEWYLRRGYRIVGEVRWEVTNYRSVVFSKAV